jgi:DNA-binding transcriptional regulator YdaS (Cro superfamily)
MAQKAMAAMGVDAKVMSQIINMEKVIAENGVPAVEIARVLSDGALPKELTDQLASLVIEVQLFVIDKLFSKISLNDLLGILNDLNCTIF